MAVYCQVFLNLNLTTTLSVINFADDGILKIIRSLNINKAHCHDDMSIII